jgi:pilus assembly protein Flp/PilA
MTMNGLTHLLTSINGNFLKGAIVLRLIKHRSGVTAIEYGLIAVAAVVVMGTVGTNLSSTFNSVANNF